MARKLKGHRVAAEPRMLSVDSYLELCKKDPTAYATAAQRMLKAIGEPVYLDTRNDPRLSRIFENRILKTYPAFEEFYGMEGAVEDVVAYFRHAAQSLEEQKQMLYLLGPVGGGKSSIAERLKQLMERCPYYVLCDKEGNPSPMGESPLGLFGHEDYETLEQEYSIPRGEVSRRLLSPWGVKRLREYGDYTKFRVMERYPSQLMQHAIAKTEPGDENNQDISALVGKVDIRKLETYAQDDPDAYSYSGGLCLANQGLLEFVEMFKAPIKVLHPLLTATQEGNFKGTEGIGAMPFDGIVLAHSNESEWKSFRNNKNNEAFLDRIYIVKVPYCMRSSEEEKIYRKLLRASKLRDATCAPGTLSMLAQFTVQSRLEQSAHVDLLTKVRVYNGEDLKGTEPKLKTIDDLRDEAGQNEGMQGISTRFAYKVLSAVFNYDKEEVAANPMHLLRVLEDRVLKEQYPAEVEQRHLAFLEVLKARYVEFIGKEIQTAYLESGDEYGQNLFDRYIMYADYWIQDQEYRDPDTGEVFDRGVLDAELEKYEKPAGVSNVKDFRNEIVNFVLRARPKHDGKNPPWNEFEKMRKVIETKMFVNIEEMLPHITVSAKASESDRKKHHAFVERMVKRGYTARQVHLLCEWCLQARKNM